MQTAALDSKYTYVLNNVDVDVVSSFNNMLFDIHIDIHYLLYKWLVNIELKPYSYRSNPYKQDQDQD